LLAQCQAAAVEGAQGGTGVPRRGVCPHQEPPAALTQFVQPEHEFRTLDGRRGLAALELVHGLYHGLGPIPIVGCDLWRVADGKIAEHWNARQTWADQSVSGHTMTDGPAIVTEPHQTAASKKLVEQFVELIMMGGDRTQITRFFDGDRFIQHNPQIADGVSGLGSAIQAGIWAAVVEQVHHIIADGEFVFSQGEGTLYGIPTAFYDLFRVKNDKLAEHWDIVFAKPDILPHSNGLF
jgi:predicted SnoaL-like aldol condensation-catalyzing enzyme